MGDDSLTVKEEKSAHSLGDQQIEKGFINRQISTQPGNTKKLHVPLSLWLSDHPCGSGPDGINAIRIPWLGRLALPA